MDPAILSGLFFGSVWLVKWPQHLGAGLLFSTKKKKWSVECCADSQKVMQCLKAEGGGGGGGGGRGWGLCKTLDRTQDLSLPNVPSCPQPQR